ncbi:hypothetical protein BH09PAT1_BH09PAT1_2720 [soil metagenome]
METIDVTTITETPRKVACDCGYNMSVLQPYRSWRAVKCECGTIWWVNPSGRRFEKHLEHKDISYE